jgi:RNA polymerase sigma factor (sigma-70 family)
MRKMLPSRADELAELAASYRTPLLNYFRRRVHSHEDAEELTQEVFVRLLRRSHLTDIKHLEGFAFATAANLLKDHYRTSARTARTDTDDEQMRQLPSLEAQPEKITEDRQQLGVLLKALEELPPRCRTIFIMHRFEDIPHSQIARRQNISVSAVEKHIANAVLILRTKLKRGENE